MTPEPAPTLLTMPLDELRARVERLCELQGRLKLLIAFLPYCPMDEGDELSFDADSANAEHVVEELDDLEVDVEIDESYEVEETAARAIEVATLPSLSTVGRAVNECLREMEGLLPAAISLTPTERLQLEALLPDPEEIEAAFEARRPPPRLADTAPTPADLAWNHIRETYERWQLAHQAREALTELVAVISDVSGMLRARVERQLPGLKLERSSGGGAN